MSTLLPVLAPVRAFLPGLPREPDKDVHGAEPCPPAPAKGIMGGRLRLERRAVGYVVLDGRRWEAELQYRAGKPIQWEVVGRL